MTVERAASDGERHRPSRNTVVLVVASALAFGVTLFLPVLGAPLIAASGVAALLSSGK